MKPNYTHERGIALLITLLLMSVLLTVSASLLNITLKQYQFASIGVASEQAFQAANAGLECLMWHDYEGYPVSKFDVGGALPSISCMEEPSVAPRIDAPTSESEAYTYRFSWGNPGVCSDMTIYKYFSATGNVDMSTALGKPGSCAQGVTCTVIRARGYNVSCPLTGDPFPPRAIEREITQRY
jgi:hypothetical protein